MAHHLSVQTRGRGLIEITHQVEEIVRASDVRNGLCHVFCLHTSASLVIQENADPSAARDLERFFDRVAPDGDPAYEHSAEGPDDMPAHIRAALTSTSELLPIVDGKLQRGTWQGLFLFEHRHRAHHRKLIVTLMGDRAPSLEPHRVKTTIDE